jgi:hypothetical protein
MRDENEIEDAPNKVTTYPPAKDPINIPIMMIFFRDILNPPALYELFYVNE